MRFIQCLALSLLFVIQAVVASAAPLAEGRWALKAGGRPVLLLELRRDPAAKSGWSGRWTRPKHFEASSNFMVFSNVEGPAASELVVDATEHYDSLELTLRDSKSELTHLLWKPSESGGSLQFTDFHIAVDLAPAAADEGVPDDWDKSRTYSAVPEWPDNAEMLRIFEEDQKVRQEWPPADLNAVFLVDQARRAQVKDLLDAGKLRSGTDFYRAAFVFQHGDKPQDFLLAHSLAVVAIARSRPDATWIAAATFDRYLQAIGQKQIYGTQFTTPKGKPTTQDPYDRTLVSDAMRSALGVPPLSEQEKRRQEYDVKP